MFKLKKFPINRQNTVKEVEVNFSYPKEFVLKPLEEQIEKIANIFGLNESAALENKKTLPKLPQGAEGWFAIASNIVLAKKYFSKTILDKTEMFCRIVQLIHQKIGESRKFYNYREGQLNSQHLRLNLDTARALNLIYKPQKAEEIIFIAAQLGLGHVGESVHDLNKGLPRTKFGLNNEFGLSSDITGQILLTHPERLVSSSELEIYCPGDEFNLCGKDFSKSTAYLINNGVVKFGAYSNDQARSGFGSATGFIPKKN